MILIIFQSFFYAAFVVALLIDVGFLPFGRDLLIPDAMVKEGKLWPSLLSYFSITMAIEMVLELTLGWIGLIGWPIVGLLVALVSIHSSRLALFGLIVFAFSFYFPSDHLTGEVIPYWKNSSKYSSFITFIQKRDHSFSYSFYVYQWDQDAKIYREIASGKSCIHVKPRVSWDSTTNRLNLYTRGWLSKITLAET